MKSRASFPKNKVSQFNPLAFENYVRSKFSIRNETIRNTSRINEVAVRREASGVSRWKPRARLGNKIVLCDLDWHETLRKRGISDPD